MSKQYHIWTDVSLALRSALRERPLARPLLPLAQLLHPPRHALVQRAVHKILREEHALKLAVGLLAPEVLPRLLKLPLPLPAALVEKGVGQLYRLTVLHLEPGVRQNLLYPLQRTDPVAWTLGQKALD